jgi:hypothetical protein
MMAFPQIGLEAVLQIQDFERNAAKYNRTLDDMNKKTARTSQAINKSTRNAADAAFDLQKQFRQAAGGVDAAATQSAFSIEKLNTSFDLLTKTSAAVTGGVVAAALAINKVLEAGEAAAALEDTRTAFVALAADSGVSAQKLISDLRDVSRGTVSTADLIRTANSALLAGGAQIADELPRLFQIAEASARATGQNADFVFQTLIRGIIKASPLLIDNAEVYVKIGAAVDDYAASLGVSTDALTEQQRQLAVLNAVTEQGGEFVDRLGGSTARATDPFRRLKTEAGALTQGISELGRGFAERLAKGIEGAIIVEKTFIANSIAVKEVVTSLGSVITGESKAIDIYRETFDRVFQTLDKGTQPIEDVAGGITDIGQAAEESTKEVDELNQKLADLATQRGERLAKIELQNARRDEDIAIQRARQLEDADRQLGRKLADQERNNARTRERIARGNAQRIADVESENAKKRRDFVAESQRAREQLERDHRENLFQINQTSQDTISEAARRNDAVAIAAALRARQRELRDEQRNKTIEQADLSRDLTLKQQKIDEDAAITLEKARQQAAQQLADQQTAEAQQEESLKLSLQRQEEDRNLAWQRQNEDLVRARERQLEDLDIWYKAQEDKLKEHLDNQAMNIKTGLNQVAQAATKAVLFADEALNRTPEQARVTRRQTFLGSEQNVGSTGLTEEEQRLLRGSFLARAEGGVDVVDRPTKFLAGEAGPELAAFVPLRNNRLDIGGSLGVNVEGVPGGMDTAAVQQVVWAAVLKLAENIQVTR